MLSEERIATFIHSLETKDSEILEIIEQEALDQSIPIIRKETQSFLKTLLRIQKPMQILEIGTAVGFSAILMHQYAPIGAKIVTIENYEKRIPIARENFKRAGCADQVRLLAGDAMAVLSELTDTFDFIFLDAAKAQYLYYLPEMVRLLKTGAVLLSDNIFQEGDIIESRFAVERRNRTIHSRMREYLYAIKHHDQLLTSIIPLGDGVALSVKSE